MPNPKPVVIQCPTRQAVHDIGSGIWEGGISAQSHLTDRAMLASRPGNQYRLPALTIASQKVGLKSAKSNRDCGHWPDWCLCVQGVE